MDSYREFVENEQNVYERFRRSGEMVAKEGLKPDSVVTNSVGGLGVVLRHQGYVAKMAGAVSERSVIVRER